MIKDNQALKGATTCKGYALKTYDDGFGPLWVYSEACGPMGVVRALSWEDAHGIVQDEIMTRVPREDLLDAFGLYVVEHEGVHSLCVDSNFIDDGQWVWLNFSGIGVEHREIGRYTTAEAAAAAGLKYAEIEQLDLMEGYEFQPNATETGIVTYDLNGQDLRPLSEDDEITPTIGNDY